MPHAKLLATLAAVAALQGCTLAKTIVHNGADPDVHRFFANRTVPAAGSPSPLRLLPRGSRGPVLEAVNAGLDAPYRIDDAALSRELV